MFVRTLRCVLSLIIICIPAAALGQARVNPDISAIGDMRYVARDAAAAEEAGVEQMHFEFVELELALQGYLNPYARADVYLALPGIEGPFELEEGYVTVTRAFPVQLRFGKFKLDTGKINSQHLHQLSWGEYPLMLQSFFSLEGANSVAVRVTRLQPVGDNAVTITLNAFDAGFFLPQEQGNNQLEPREVRTQIGASSRLSFFRSLTDFTHLDIGASYLWAPYDPEQSNLTTQVAGLDVKYKWQPNTRTGLIFSAEAMLSDREVEMGDSLVSMIDKVTAHGAFSFLEYRFRRRWDVGSYFDYTQSASNSDLQIAAGGGWLAFSPAEETARFSLIYRYEDSDLQTEPTQRVSFQVIWSLGPHQPHPF